MRSLSHELSCSPPVSGFEACRGCYLYSSDHGCTADGCWMEKARPYGMGSGRKRQVSAPAVSDFYPSQRANRRRSTVADVDQEQFLSLYHEKRMNDVAIGREMGFPPWTIRKVRMGLGLPSNYRQRKKNAARRAGTPTDGKT